MTLKIGVSGGHCPRLPVNILNTRDSFHITDAAYDTSRRDVVEECGGGGINLTHFQQTQMGMRPLLLIT